MSKKSQKPQSKKKKRDKKKSKKSQKLSSIESSRELNTKIEVPEKIIFKKDYVVEKTSPFSKINVDNVVKYYYEVKNDTDKKFDSENTAALKIQTGFRGYLARREFFKKKTAAIAIQRWYRGYKYGRKVYLEKLKAKKEKERMDYYHVCATKIQALYRGYVSRKRVFDFNARKEELANIEEQNKKMANYVKEKIRMNKLKRKRKAKKKKAKMLKKIAPKLHYLLSTRTIPGVLNNTSLVDTSMVVKKKTKKKKLKKLKMVRVHGLEKKMSQIMRATVRSSTSVGK